MPKRDAVPAGAPVWIELSTSDAEKSQAFYAPLFGWDVQDPGPEFGGYKNFLKGDVQIAGLMGHDGTTGQPDAWGIYLTTPDIKATVDAAAASGATVFVPPMEVSTLGSMAVMADPTGAMIGAWQPNEMQGFGLIGEEGAPSWFELHTSDYDTAVPFYRDVFEWDTHTVSDSPEFRYTTLGADDGQEAGIMDAAAENAPSYWALYFHVEDADTTFERVTELGGTVLEPPVDTPYGRIGTAVDPVGARFKLRQAL
jgi:predicted enzyme related to lactoylglutathione lyase